MTNKRRTFANKIVRLLTVPTAAVVAVLLVELFCHLFFPLPKNQQLYRISFYDGPDTIFHNQGDIFTWVPHSEIRDVTIFYSEDDFRVEFDYRKRTNNFGLVQDEDIVPGRDSFLLLGDSFSQGVGSEPWFRQVAPAIVKLGYQPINGGLQGTGFEQWLKLEQYLTARNIRIRKLAVLFISDDYTRGVFNYDNNVLQCLSALTLCRLEESVIYRLPPQEELSSWITKIRAARTKKFWLREHIEALLPRSYSTYRYFKYLKSTVQSGGESRAAIIELIRKYGSDNVAFIHLPRKHEINGPDPLAMEARRSIQEAGGRLFDGIKLCGLTATDYYAIDDHPNSKGYTKIAGCVTNVVNGLIAGESNSLTQQ